MGLSSMNRGPCYVQSNCPAQTTNDCMHDWIDSWSILKQPPHPKSPILSTVQFFQRTVKINSKKPDQGPAPSLFILIKDPEFRAQIQFEIFPEVGLGLGLSLIHI